MNIFIFIRFKLIVFICYLNFIYIYIDKIVMDFESRCLLKLYVRLNDIIINSDKYL